MHTYSPILSHSPFERTVMTLTLYRIVVYNYENENNFDFCDTNYDKRKKPGFRWILDLLIHFAAYSVHVSCME